MIEDLDYKFDDLIEDQVEIGNNNLDQNRQFNELPQLGQYQQNSPVQENQYFEPQKVETSVLEEEQAQNFYNQIPAESPILQKSPEQLNQMLEEDVASDDSANNQEKNDYQVDNNSELNSYENSDSDEIASNEYSDQIEQKGEIEDEANQDYQNVGESQIMTEPPEVQEIDQNQYEQQEDESDEVENNEEVQDYDSANNSEQQAADFIEQNIANEGTNYGDDIELNVPESNGEADSSLQYKTGF